MTIDELRAKHFWNVQLANKYSYLLREDKTYLTNNHTCLSIEFTINVLEEYKAQALKYDLWSNTFDDKIQELKEYLDEKV